jgi:effector-binding domain-containing protein
MADRVWIETVSEQPVAAVRVRAAQSEIANVFRDSLDKVWAFLRKHDGLRTDGNNVFIYHKEEGPNKDGKITIELGVQVTRAFIGEGDVICTSTPAGRAATAIHLGAYRRLFETHSALEHWCAAHGHELAGVNWEIYGDWNEDQSKLETHVRHLLR